MKGLSPRNLIYMASFAAAWPDLTIAQQPAAQLPWGHHLVLLDKLEGAAEREWYAARAVQEGWSRAVLEHMIASGLHRRVGAALSNFAAVLPPGDSDLAQALTRDPYDLEFLTLTAPVAERDLEDALMAHLQRFLLEFGAGFAFVGRQFRLPVGEEEFFVDPLFFNYLANRFVVIELKTRKLTPADVGQLNFYVNAIDGQIRQPGHDRTIGILLCAARDETVTRYALAGVATPLAVAGYTHNELPTELQATLPDLGGLVQPFLDSYQPAVDQPAEDRTGSK